ncbi:MAG: FGGY family carbohydrate kinase [Chloroflexi bacterium]|nr:FGGY family carbohydrate kinase [Chloroflexota bacterium]
MALAAYLGLDIGGTGAKAAVYDRTGCRLGAGYATYAPSMTEQGRAEIPIEWIEAAGQDAVRQAVDASGAQIVALSVVSQGQTFVALDRDDRPVYPAIIWYDSRATAEAEELAAAVAAALPHGPAPFIEAIAAAPKILWLRRHLPERMARARRYLLLPDYFNHRLTGQAVTDPCTASTTALYVDGAADYSPEALAAAHIDRGDMARIQTPGSPIARVLPHVAESWRLSPETLVVTGTNDQYAGALGAGNCRPGIVSETTGTCLALVSLYEARPEKSGFPSPGLITGRFPIEGYQYALAYAKTAGLVVDWFQRQFAPGHSLPDLETMAATSPPGSNGVTVLPHFDGMVSPQPNAAAHGALLNLALGHTLADMYRAVLESIAFSLRENLELMRDNGLAVDTVRAIGGGAKSDLWLQIKADVTGVPIERPAVTEAATLGAAMLAAVGAGEFGAVAECSATFYRVGSVFVPDAIRHELYEQPYQAYRALYRRLYGD